MCTVDGIPLARNHLGVSILLCCTCKRRATMWVILCVFGALAPPPTLALLARTGLNRSSITVPDGMQFKTTSDNYFLFSELWFGTKAVTSWKSALGHLAGQPNVRAIEVGSFQGLSAVWLLQNVLTHATSTILCIDTFDGGPEYLDYHTRSMYELFLHNTRPFGTRVKHLRGYSQQRLRNLPPTPTYDIAYIDGSHKAVHVLEDAVLVFPMMKVGAVIIFDDYLWQTPGPWQPVTAPEDRPGMAIDAFLAIYKPYVELIYMDYQVMVRKTSEAVPAG